jgi:hypothetical protein
MELEFSKLLIRYDALRNELFNYTNDYFDAMGYDIDGYEYQLNCDDFNEIDNLRNQVESFELILKGVIKLKYIFG